MRSFKISNPGRQRRHGNILLAGTLFLASLMSVALPAGAQIVEVPGNTALENVAGQTPAQADMARSIGAVCPTLVNNVPQLNATQLRLQQICTRMVQTATNGANDYGLNDEQLNNALQVINGEELQAPQTQLVNVRDTQLGNIAARLEALRSASNTSPLSIAGLRTLPTEPWQVAASGDDVPIPGTEAAGGGRFGVFISGNYGEGDKDETGELEGFDFDHSGLTIGADYRLSAISLAGVALGYSDFSADFDTSANSVAGQFLDNKSYTVSLYGTYLPSDSLFFDAVASVGYSDYDARRRVVINSLTAQPSESHRLDSSFNGYTYGLNLAAGYDISQGGFLITPAAAIDYIHLEVDDYDEDGVDLLNGGESPLALSVGGSSADSLAASIGAQISYPISFEGGVLNPTLRGRWLFELADDEDGARLIYANDPTTLSAFRLTTEDKDTNFGLIEAGVSVTLPQDFSMFAEYGTVIGLDDFTAHRLSIGLRKGF